MFAKITYLENGISYVEAEGKLDIYTAPNYLDDIKDYIKSRYVRELILEFSKIRYVASIGLRALLELYKIMQERDGILKLRNVNDEVLHAFNMTGYDDFLTIEYDCENPEIAARNDSSEEYDD